VKPVPVVPLEEKERAVFETLAGSPLPQVPVPAPVRIPAVEEVQTILAVDDDPSVLQLMEHILNRASTACDGGAASEALANREAMPDLRC
jgi:hypothetical protein